MARNNYHVPNAQYRNPTSNNLTRKNLKTKLATGKWHQAIKIGVKDKGIGILQKRNSGSLLRQ